MRDISNRPKPQCFFLNANANLGLIRAVIDSLPSRDTPLKVLVLGDSMADDYRSVPHFFIEQLAGIAGAGVDIESLAVGGSNWNTIQTNLAATTAAISAYDPDLMIWAWKEWPDIGIDFETRMADTAPQVAAAGDCPVLYFSPYYRYANGGEKAEVKYGYLASQANGWAYYDQLPFAVSYDHQVANGYMADTVHMNETGGLVFALKAFQDISSS